ncbi:MAG: type I glyceraldehyde-3-phosphate dehydrogenase [Candidatus Woesearchaeota archaeon]
MNTIKVAINGFGRIGRMVYRAALQYHNIEIIACNDLTDKKTLAHLFKYDSVHGRFPGEVRVTERGISVNGNEMVVLSEKNPEKLPWNEMGVDIVVESTGLFRTKEKAEQHLKAGARKVIISAPASDENVKTFVLGVNEHEYDPANDHVISNASCTTNCLAPIVKVLDDNFGVEKGFMTTTHAYTGDQRIVDAPHKDLRRARAAARNTIPTSTGAAKAVGKVMPHLKGKLDGIAMRVPVADGSITDFVAVLKKETTTQEINELMKNVSQHHLNEVLDYTEEPLVSSDIVGNPHSSIFDAPLTFTQGNMVKVVSWYDNEWGYSNRVCDMILRML